MIVPMVFDWVDGCDEGHARTYRDGLTGLYDCTTRKEVLAPTFQAIDSAGSLRNGSMLAALPGKGWGLYTLTGQELRAPGSEPLSARLGLFFAGETALWPNGRPIGPATKLVDVPHNGMLIQKNEAGLMGLRDQDGRWRIPAIYTALDCGMDDCEGIVNKRTDVYNAETLVRRQADPPLPPPRFVEAKVDGRWVLKNRAGSVVASNLVYDEDIEEAEWADRGDGTAQVHIKGMGWGMVDTTGRVVLPFVYRSDRGYPFPPNTADPKEIKGPSGLQVFYRGKISLPTDHEYWLVGGPQKQENGHWTVSAAARIGGEDKVGAEGLHDLTAGRWVAPPRYRRAFGVQFSNYAVLVENGGRNGVYLVDRDRTIFLDGLDIDGYSPRNGLLKVKRGNKFGVARLDGSFLIEPIHDFVGIDDSADRMFVGGNDGIAIFATTGRRLTDFKFKSSSGSPLFNGESRSATLLQNGDKVVVGLDGRVLARESDFNGPLEVLYGCINTIAARCFFGQKEAGSDQVGQVLINGRHYDRVGANIRSVRNFEFSGGLLAVQDVGKFGYVDTYGRLAIPLTFDHATNFFAGTAKVSIAGKWFRIDRTGKRLVEPTMGDIEDFRMLATAH